MNIETPINILVRRRAAIGDVIMSTGVVRELKKRYRQANIDVVTEKLSVWRNNPHIRNMYHVNDPPAIENYELYINLDNAYEANPVNHFVDSMFYRAFGPNQLDRSVELFPDDADRDTVDRDLAEFGERFVVVHMRNWHYSQKNVTMDVWLDVYAKLFELRTDFNIVVVGGTTDYTVDHPMFFDRRDRYNDQQIKYLCDHAQCFVGIDSGPYWCAAASKAPIVALLTNIPVESILPHRRHEMGYKCTAVQTQEDCRGCYNEQARPVVTWTCKKGTTPCNNNFDTDAIVNAIAGYL
jgi:ADP-heptose:LPS heptosyltransferase